MLFVGFDWREDENMNQNAVNEMNLKDLLIYWALHFRSAFILCICAFILLGCYKGYNATLKEDAAVTESGEHTKDDTVVTTYEVTVSNDPNLDASKFNKTYITVMGKEATIGQGIASAIIQNREDNSAKNVAYEISVKTEGEKIIHVEKASYVFIKYGVAGAVAMLFFHLLFFALKYAMSAEIITLAQQDEILGIPVLARKRDAIAVLYKGRGGMSCTLRRIGGLSVEESDMEHIADMRRSI